VPKWTYLDILLLKVGNILFRNFFMWVNKLNKIFVLLSVTLASLCLYGCGIKGPLYIEEDPNTTSKTVTATPDTDESQTDDQEEKTILQGAETVNDVQIIEDSSTDVDVSNQ